MLESKRFRKRVSGAVMAGERERDALKGRFGLNVGLGTFARRITLSLKVCYLKGCQRVEKRPLTPPGSGAGSVASCSTRASTSERCDGESLTNAFHNLKPCTVSLEGNPSWALTSEVDVRFFIPRLLAANSSDNNKPKLSQ